MASTAFTKPCCNKARLITDVATVDGEPVRERLALTMEPVGLRLRLRVRAPESRGRLDEPAVGNNST
jgi:hypothetical protein